MQKPKFMDQAAFDIFSKMFDNKLPDNQYKIFLKMKKEILNLIQNYINNMLKQEVDKYIHQNHDANVRFYKTKRKTFLGEIDINYPMFQNPEYKSNIVQTKSIMLFFEIFGLIELIRSTTLSYSQLKKFFKTFDINISCQMIADIVNAIKELGLKDDNH